MTTPAQRVRVYYETCLTGEPWGVWDHHERRWVVEPTLPYEDSAWSAKLGVDSLHPWDLEPAQCDFETGGAARVCDDCDGSGDDGYEDECYECDGIGVVLL